MLNRLHSFFQTYLSPTQDGAGEDPSHASRLAVAALLVEIAISDFDASSEERRMILQIVSNGFRLTAGEAKSLLSMAEAEHHASTDYFQFTRQ